MGGDRYRVGWSKKDMILHVLSHAWTIRYNWYVQRVELACRANTGDYKELRGAKL